MVEEKHEEHAAHEHARETHAHTVHEHATRETEKHSAAGSAGDGGKKPFSRTLSENYGFVGGITLILIALIGAYFIMNSGGSASSGSGASPSPVAPLALSVTRIRAPDCSDCFDVDQVLQELSSKGVVLNLRVLDYSSAEAKALVSKYNVQKLPTLLFSGDEKRRSETTSLLSSFASMAPDGTFVLSSQNPPFFDVAKGRVVGRVDFISLVSVNCTQCFNISLLVAQLGAEPPLGLGVKVASERIVDFESVEGRKLVEAYNISTVPSLVASSELGEYAQVVALWPRVGSVEADGSFVFRAPTPPFVNLSNNAVEGLVKIIYLTDSSCVACYDARLHKQVLERMGVFVENESEVDVNSTLGRRLVEAYNVTLVPTVIFSPDARVYGGLLQVWSQVGSVEGDGWFVFRNMTVLGNAVFKNVKTGEVFGLPSPSPSSSLSSPSSSSPSPSLAASQSNQSNQGKLTNQTNQTNSNQTNSTI